MPFFKTVRSGEKALIINRQGVSTVVIGPQRPFVLTKKFQRLVRYSADQKQYVRLQHSNGAIEHIPGSKSLSSPPLLYETLEEIAALYASVDSHGGSAEQRPYSLFMNPLEMESAEVLDSISLDANEVLVVYQREMESGGVTRRIQHGPTVFTPSANEWLHTFIWHGTDPSNKTRKIPGGLKFTKLRVIPDQFYLNIDDVRTKDDALITVKQMVFFELRDIEVMLNQTADPIADFINAVQADVVAFASQLTYEEFMDNSSKLNDLQHYPQLTTLSGRIGYAITKVVFRGYHTSDKLQTLHDRAVERRSALKVQMESEQQSQDLTDSKLRNEQQRNILKQGLELDEEKHKHALQKEQLVHQLKLDEKEHEEKIEREKSKRKAKVQAERALQEEEVAHLEKLKSLGVDLTDYLVSQHPKPNQVLRVITKGDARGGNVHIHP